MRKYVFPFSYLHEAYSTLSGVGLTYE